MAQEGVWFGILGPSEVRVADTIVALGTPKQRAVLAMLVLHRNRTVGTDELINAAWGDGAPRGAPSTLHTYVSNLRRLITGPGVDPHKTLTRAAPGYRLSVPDSDCDVGRFITERTKGVRAASDAHFEEASSHFTAALAHWRGPMLDDLRDFIVFDAFTAALAEDKLVTQIARAEAENACGRPHSVINELEALTTDHPYREPLWAQLITAYYLADHQSDALDAYHRLRRALAEDLGIGPGPRLRGLYEQVLHQQPLNTGKAAQANADETIIVAHRENTETDSDAPVLRDSEGRVHPLAMSTRIGRSPDNDIVLTDGKVSRHHAAIIDTGSSFVIADLRSANGVYVRDGRIHTSATLANGDVIGVGDHKFTFEATAHGPDLG
ncbi:BTAD domain-containing putative transcriptional regulator [Mycobacterium sp. ITM-2016-00318]|uniref:BTAD domain-containing putative transcriptional regulator n=1 Tax=Mycobacterium sp. ITM-2016-00318 TaxID=2099693 RepID=UPI000CF9C68B|nr:BTAD domain-containing putative transcriptional regulator [Mycobacterium sp. ITM-2016-00318]WNG94326.1 BTAD domain-containing putative transcriptional regulator [Mycobacterium sp. ITM-2016-00318]